MSIEENGELREININASLHRPDSLFGAERKPVLLSAMISSMFFLGAEIKFVIMGFISWIILLFLLRLVFKADPLMRPIYLRHRLYQRFYSAHSKPSAIGKKVYKP